MGKKGKQPRREETAEDGYGAGPGEFYVQILSGATVDSAPLVIVGTKRERYALTRQSLQVRATAFYCALVPGCTPSHPKVPGERVRGRAAAAGGASGPGHETGPAAPDAPQRGHGGRAPRAHHVHGGWRPCLGARCGAAGAQGPRAREPAL